MFSALMLTGDKVHIVGDGYTTMNLLPPLTNNNIITLTIVPFKSFSDESDVYNIKSNIITFIETE